MMFRPQRYVLKINLSKIEDTGTYMCLENGTVKNTTHLFVHGLNQYVEGDFNLIVCILR